MSYLLLLIQSVISDLTLEKICDRSCISGITGKIRSMVDLQSALSKNWSVDEKKLPNPTMGKKTGQSTGSNKMNCHIRLTTRALARGATFIKICRNR